MIRGAITFFVLALVAFFLGAYQMAGLSMEIGKMLLGLFMVFALLLFVGGLFLGKKIDTVPMSVGLIALYSN